MQPIVVQKYGGTSVANPERIRQVAQRIADTRAQGKAVVAVVSAMGHTTDELLAQARQLSSSPSRRELDMLLSCGERASMALLSMAIHELGLEAISFTGSQSGILTNDRHSGARIIEVRPVRVQDELERGRVVIVAGFQGVSYRREITTLGRGGSDTTAVALAAALGAEFCEICSDVAGVFSTDPRVVSAAQLIDAISHDEMLELASHGAVVLHPESVEFARRSGIALFARRTADPPGGGTRVDSAERIDPPATGRARGVAGVSHLIALGAREPNPVCAILAAHRVPIWQTCHHKGGTELYVELSDVPDWARVEAELRAAGVSLETGLGAVSVVGTGVGADPEVLYRVLAAQASPPRALITSPLRITVVCPSAAVADLTGALHAALVEATA